MSFRKQSLSVLALLVVAVGPISLPVLAQSTPTAPAATVAAPPAAPATQAPAAQSTSAATTVHGTITDPDGELIPGASITFTPAKGGAGKTIVSGSDGTYSVPLTPGTYSFVVTMKGFSSYSALAVKIPSVTSTTLDAKLTVGAADQVINVDANSVQLSVDPESNQSSTIISGKDLDALSDDPDELTSQLQALAGPSAGPNGGQIYVDGFTGGQLPPKSSIREIRINQNPFSAQYDRLGFGRIEVFTKPGTDKLHGSIQTNYDPSYFNSGTPPNVTANTYSPPYHTLFIFGSLTGPLSKWASYNIGGSHRDIQEDSYTYAQILALPSTPTVLCNPGAAGTAGCVQTTYTALTFQPQSRTDISPRIDLALGDKNVLTTRFQYVQNDSTNSGTGGTSLPSQAVNSDSKSFELQMSDTQTLSSRLINEDRFEYERERSTSTSLSNVPTVSVSGTFSAGSAGAQNASTHTDHFEFQNYTSLALKKNFVRIGGRLRVDRTAENSQANTNGSFTYASLFYNGTGTDNSYATGTPTAFSYTVVNVPKIGDTLADLGIYAETDWKARQNLTISYGIRYETQNNLPADHHDFAPRVSMAYGVGPASKAPKTVIRGGFGMFYDRFSGGNVLTLNKQNGISTTVYSESTVPAGCTPQSFVVNKANCIGGVQSTALSTYTASSTLRTPYTIQAAIGADQQLGRFGTLSVNYIHSQGVHQLATQNIDYPTGANPVLPPAGSAVKYQYFTEGVFNQNQLTVNGRVQTTKWLSLGGYYAINSAHGDTSGAGSFITTPYNMAADYGRTGFAVRNRMLLYGSVTMPHYIQFSPFLIGQSGNPYNITEGIDLNKDSILTDRPYLVPLGTVGAKTINGCGTFVSRTAGTAPAGSQVVPINYCTGPALFTFNFRLTKTFGFGGQKQAAVDPNAAGRQGQGQPGGQPGGGSRGGGSRGGAPGGAMMGMGGGGTSTGKRYNLGVGLIVNNLFGNQDLSTPNGTLLSPTFGTSTQLTSGAYTTSNAIRRIAVQASFNF
jgi:hypothetical protein